MSDKMEICNIFDNYFSSFGEQLAQNFVNTDNSLKYLNNRNDIRFEFTPVTYEYVLDVFSKLSDSSVGYDMILMWVYKNKFFL